MSDKPAVKPAPKPSEKKVETTQNPLPITPPPDAVEAPKKRGRKPGQSNKPKATASPKPAAVAPSGNQLAVVISYITASPDNLKFIHELISRLR